MDAQEYRTRHWGSLADTQSALLVYGTLTKATGSTLAQIASKQLADPTAAGSRGDASLECGKVLAENLARPPQMVSGTASWCFSLHLGAQQRACMRGSVRSCVGW